MESSDRTGSGLTGRLLAAHRGCLWPPVPCLWTVVGNFGSGDAGVVGHAVDANSRIAQATLGFCESVPVEATSLLGQASPRRELDFLKPSRNTVQSSCFSND